MDVIDIRRLTEPATADDPDGCVFAAVFINGIDLRTLVVATDEAELTERYWNEEFVNDNHQSLEEWLEPSNWIAFLAPVDVAPPSRHWLGAPDPDWTEHGRAAVLTCTCGTFGCGGAAARITLDKRTVTWSDFRHANSGPEIPIGPFHFSRSVYTAAISALKHAY